jgi:enoyl-CoA hydratase
MIHREQHDSVALLRIEHGKVQALDLELCCELAQVFEQVDDWTDTRAVVLTGSGTSFSAGVDLKRVLDGGAAYTEQFLPALDRALGALFRCPKPVVAALNGHAIAGGYALACAADIRIMARGKGRVGMPELAVGVPFPWMALETVRLSTPIEHLQELLYFGETYNAEDALARGLVDEAIEPDALARRALEVATKLSRMQPASFALAKRQLRQASLDAWALQRSHETMVRMAWAAPETHAAIRAYLEGLKK